MPRLRRLRIEEGSFVDDGDNPEARIVFLKRLRKGTVSKGRLSDALNARIDELASEDMPRADIVQSMAEAAGIDSSTVNSILAGEIEKPPMDRLRGFAEVLDLSAERLADLAGLEDEPEADKQGGEEDMEELQKLRKDNAELREQLAKFQAEETQEEPTDVLKSLPDDIRKQIEQDRADLAKTRARLDDEIAKRRTREFVEKAETLNLGIESAELGDLLQKIEAADSDNFDATLQKLRAISEQRDEASQLLKAIGQAGQSTDSSDAYEQLRKLAQERANSTGESFHVAMLKVRKTNRDLVNQAHADMRGE